MSRTPKVGDWLLSPLHGAGKILEVNNGRIGDQCTSGKVDPGGRSATIHWEGPMADLFWDEEKGAWRPK